MGLPGKAVAYIELEDYLVLENASQFRHEYLDGVIYSVQGEPVRGMAGLQHILLLSSMEEAAWFCERVSADGTWTSLQPWERGSTLALPGLGVDLAWSEVYAGVGLG